MTADISPKDKEILRELAKQVAEIAALPVQKEKKEMWKRLNGLKPVRPMVWITEFPWHEMNVDNELTILSENKICRVQETELRKILYQWKHCRVDMVVEPTIYSDLVVNDTGFGISDAAEIVTTDQNSDIVSRHFIPQIREEEDLGKIKTPVITYNAEETENNYRILKDIYDGILNVEKRGVNGFRAKCSPWDDMVTWWGVEELFIDLHERPEMVHKAIDRLINAHIKRLEQYEALNLLTLNNGFNQPGSGAYGYTDDLPQKDFDSSHVRAKDLWGASASQIFSSVSPEMHDEFALHYEIKWMERFGLSYYGCCDPLHKKTEILKKIPNLRKVSMSRWINVSEAAENIGSRYVFSYKPNSAVLATKDWSLDEAKEELADVFEKAEAKGCVVEIVLKNLSTVQYEPQRIWEWAGMVEELVNA